MTTDTTLIQRIKDLTARFGKGWHDGIQIDASDIADLCLAADALEQQAAEEANALRTSLAHWKVFGEHAEGERSRLQGEVMRLQHELARLRHE